jgi:hypothetical protein
MPAKAGIQKYLKTLDSRLRGNDTKGRFKTIYESIIIKKYRDFYFGDTDEHGLPGYQKLEKNIYENLCPNLT